jgi:hypothetical protein
VTNPILWLARAFQDIVQLLNVFFEHAQGRQDFPETRACVAEWQPKLLLVSPHLLVQLSHVTPDVVRFVHYILFGLLLEHFHELIFSAIVMTKSEHAGAAAPAVYDEVVLIQQCFVRASVTWLEMARQPIAYAYDQEQCGADDWMAAVPQRFAKPALCEIYAQFMARSWSHIAALESALRAFEACRGRRSPPSAAESRTSLWRAPPHPHHPDGVDLLQARGLHGLHAGGLRDLPARSCSPPDQGRYRLSPTILFKLTQRSHHWLQYIAGVSASTREKSRPT